MLSAVRDQIRMMELHGSLISQPTRACYWFAKMNGLSVKFINVDGAKGDNRTPEYLARNPNGTFPLLVDGDFVLYESCAILRYLASKHSLDQWYPTDTRRRAKVDQYLDWHHGTLRVGAAGLCRAAAMAKVLPSIEHNSWAKDIEDVPERFYRRKLHQALAVLDGVLAESTYLAGDTPTLCDVSAVCEVVQLELLPAFTLPPNVQRWRERMASLPEYDSSHKMLRGFVKFTHKRLAKL